MVDEKLVKSFENIDNFGNIYEESCMIAGHFGVNDDRALMIIFISELKNLNHNLANIDFSLREGKN